MVILLYVIIIAALTISFVLGVVLTVMSIWDIAVERKRGAWEWSALIGGAMLAALAVPLVIHFFYLSLEEFESKLNQRRSGITISAPEPKKADLGPPFRLPKDRFWLF